MAARSGSIRDELEQARGQLMTNATASRMTWGRLRIAGLIGGVLVLVLLAVVVLANVFAGPSEQEQAAEQAGVVDGQRVTNLDELGMLTPPKTEDPAVFGPLAAAALFTYDTRLVNYFDAELGIKAWLVDYETEPRGSWMDTDADEAIRRSDFPSEGTYREQSELQIVATAVVVGEPKIGGEHRDISEEGAKLSSDGEAFYTVTTDLEVTYEFTAEEGDRRTYVERFTVTAYLSCGQNNIDSRPTANCAVRQYAEEFLI